MLPVVPVTFTVCLLETAEAFAVNVALVDVAGTVTEPGTASFVLLLASPTVTPPFGAEPDRVTLQESAAVPVIVVVLQDRALIVGAELVPAPLRLTT